MNRSLQHRSNMNDLVRRGIQSEEEDWGSCVANPQMTPILRSKVSELEMKMKKHMMEQKCVVACVHEA